MLQPNKLPEHLLKICTGGVRYALLLRSDGMILASSRDALEKAEKLDEELVGVISSGIWINLFGDAGQSPEKSERSADGERESERWMIIECEEGRLALAPIGRLLLCIKSDTSVQLGLLKKKAE
mmetsp:Transcript_5822/g.17418  ORF Transcript_5822/g.17418 Transcript_5822/m.17418 type:complete len:124 (-) Transcript_5822:1311-1682(-)